MPLDPLDEARILKDAPTTQPLRLPLHVALFVSPVFLLAPINLHNRDWDRTSLFQVCQQPIYRACISLCEKTFRAFGNQKPDVLVKYEKLLWRTIYQVATRELDIFNATQAFLSGINWQELDSLPKIDIGWFETTLGTVFLMNCLYNIVDVPQIMIYGFRLTSTKSELMESFP